MKPELHARHLREIDRQKLSFKGRGLRVVRPDGSLLSSVSRETYNHKRANGGNRATK